MLNLPLSKKQISIKMPSITRHLQSIDKRLDAIEMFVRSLSPRTATVAPLSIDTAIDSFLAHRHFSDLRLKQYEVLRRALHRFELFRRHTVSANYNLAFDRMSADDLYAFDDFLADEHNIYVSHPDIYAAYPAAMRGGRPAEPQPRGRNSLYTYFKRLRAVTRWCVGCGLTDNDPFQHYMPRSAERYGTPIYISDEEVLALARHDFSSDRRLAVQRDIFVFQCSVGCRYGDLRRMTSESVTDDTLEYIPSKTADEHPVPVRVPLTPRCVALVSRYRGLSDRRLFPFISQQKYNAALKAIFRAAGITRTVTRLNPVTGVEDRIPICDLASSHMARRTFVGNLYRKFKDPSLISSLSGHTDGSRAFARYRAIDDELRREVVASIGY